nr:MAG TPA: hypothetical protein [Caudoviricetes sp.]
MMWNVPRFLNSTGTPKASPIARPYTAAFSLSFTIFTTFFQCYLYAIKLQCDITIINRDAHCINPLFWKGNLAIIRTLAGVSTGLCKYYSAVSLFHLGNLIFLMAYYNILVTNSQYALFLCVVFASVCVLSDARWLQIVDITDPFPVIRYIPEHTIFALFVLITIVGKQFI